MPTSNAQAKWTGDLKTGKGDMKAGSGAFETSFSFKTRFQGAEGTNPEELIGGALAGCFSMAFSGGLGGDGYEPESIETNAEVTLEEVDDDFAITTITLNTEADVPGIDEETFQEHAQAAKENCPVSKALKGVNIKLNATLK